VFRRGKKEEVEDEVGAGARGDGHRRRIFMEGCSFAHSVAQRLQGARAVVEKTVPLWQVAAFQKSVSYVLTRYGGC
jgi:hypothetical protein